MACSPSRPETLSESLDKRTRWRRSASPKEPHILTFRKQWLHSTLSTLSASWFAFLLAARLFDGLEFPSKMSSRLSAISLLAANILIPIAISIFASGFFPYKPFLPGLAQFETEEHGHPQEAPFNKLIFMVVDALRRWDHSGLARKLKLIRTAILCTRTIPGLHLPKGMVSCPCK